MFIDDDFGLIESVRSNFPADKIYVLPDYKCNRHVQGKNVYHVKTSVSDLQDEDFAIAALEIQTKQLDKN